MLEKGFGMHPAWIEHDNGLWVGGVGPKERPDEENIRTLAENGGPTNEPPDQSRKQESGRKPKHD